MKRFFCLEHAPNFDEITKTSDTFWKKTTYEKLKDGSHFGSIKVKVYKDQASSFILCRHDTDNDEYIFNIKQDGTIAEGIFRHRRDNGSTAIGSRYFSRSGRGEDRMHRLYKDKNSEAIKYIDEIKLKHDSVWRALAVYSFNPQTLDWTLTKKI